MIAALRKIENAAMWLACAALFLMGAIVTASVIGRVAFNLPVPDDLIMVGLLMVCVIVLPLAFVERADGHIAVTVIVGAAEASAAKRRASAATHPRIAGRSRSRRSRCRGRRT